MNWSDESQWDETTCDSAVCQHPQCWAATRRIERGHPRMLNSPCKTFLDTEDKLPVLTIVNVSDSCHLPERLAQHHSSGFTFTKTYSSLPRHSKFDSKIKTGLRCTKAVTDKDLVSNTNRPCRASVLNLNKTLLPCHQHVSNMAVIWIPEKPEQHKSPAEKKPDVTSCDRMKKKRKSLMANQSALGSLERQDMRTQLESHDIIVPPPSPMHVPEQLSVDSILPWAPLDTLPEELLKDFLKDEDKAVTSSDIKIALTMMKKNSPLDKSRPESAVSSKMFLSVHRLTLQSPGLRHPEHLKKLHYGLMIKPVFPKAARLPGPTKSQQQQRRRKGKISTKKQEIKKKTKSDPESLNTLQKFIVIYDPTSELNVDTVDKPKGPSQFGDSSLSDQESEIKQQQIESEGPALKQDATEEPDRNHPDNYPASFPRRKSPTELIKTEFIKKDIGSQVEVGLEFQTSSEEEILKNLTARIAGITWNPEFKLLRLLQASDDEDVEDQSSRTPSEQSLEAQAGSMTWGNQDA